MTDLTKTLSAVEQGDARAAESLLPLVYEQLRELAAQKLASEKPGHSLQATALVHEAYLRLVDQQPAVQWTTQGHFFAAAAEAMRRILVESARRKRSSRPGGNLRRIDLSAAAPSVEGKALDLVALDNALQQLEHQAPEKAKLVKLRFFAGLSIQEAAEALGISPATAKGHWTYARAWLYGQLKNSQRTSEP